MTTKIVDSKGRIMLGSEFAGVMMIVDDSTPGRLILQQAVAVPITEAWLHKNKKAYALVSKGLKHAKTGQFSKTPPNLTADVDLADSIEE